MKKPLPPRQIWPNRQRRGVKLDPFIKKPHISCGEDYDKLAGFTEKVITTNRVQEFR
jgi:hypothetical protein